MTYGFKMNGVFVSLRTQHIVPCKDVKRLLGMRLPFLKLVTVFQNEQPVIKKFQTPICICLLMILIYELIHSMITDRKINSHIRAIAIPR